MIGGQAGLAGHLKIGRGARIGAQAGVMSDVVAGAEVIGTPAEPLKDFWRRIAVSRRLSKSAKAVPFNTKPGSREPGDTRD
jgi:UDP-3-O-[3-hydroxymyristoyl] glucosamine N-acyltransferase